jgi:hypothetical protein
VLNRQHWRTLAKRRPVLRWNRRQNGAEKLRKMLKQLLTRMMSSLMTLRSWRTLTGMHADTAQYTASMQLNASSAACSPIVCIILPWFCSHWRANSTDAKRCSSAHAHSQHTSSQCCIQNGSNRVLSATC